MNDPSAATSQTAQRRDSGPSGALDAARPNADPGKEVDGVMQRAAELEPEWSVLKPLRGCKGYAHRDIGEGGGGEQDGKTFGGVRASGGQ